jgi:hypothetical protein
MSELSILAIAAPPIIGHGLYTVYPPITDVLAYNNNNNNND